MSSSFRRIVNPSLWSLIACLLPSGALSREAVSATAFVDLVLRNDPRVLSAEADLAGALADTRAAELWLNPDVDAEASRTESGPASATTRLSIRQPVPLSGRRQHAFRTARHAAEGARAGLEEARWLVAIEATVGLVRLRQIGDESEFARKNIAMCQTTLERLATIRFLTDEQQLAGTATRLSREANLSRASLLASEELALKERLTTSGGGGLASDWQVSMPARNAWPEWPSASGQSASLARVRAEAQAAEERVLLARSAGWPDLAIGPFVELDDSGPGLQAPSVWGVGLGLTLPVFNRNQGAIARAEVESRAASVMRGNTERAESLRVRTLARRYELAVARLTAIGAEMASGERDIAVMRQTYRSGRIPASLVLEILRSYQELLEEFHTQEIEALQTYWEGSFLLGTKEMPWN